jgi:glutathionylspermidine synthase
LIRNTVAQRPDWSAKVEAEGLVWHTVEGVPYWHEGVYYQFSMNQIDEIERATAELYRIFILAGEKIANSPFLLAKFGIPAKFHGVIKESWNAEPPALNYGRFDLGYDGKSAPKLFEFNCDTPTSLLEASVIQWTWKEEVFPSADQFNSLHDKLIAKWQDIAPYLPSKVIFAHGRDDVGEDTVTMAYLRDTAQAAGIETDGIIVDDIGYDHDNGYFVDLNDEQLDACFKLFPWEWMVNQDYAEFIPASMDTTLWLEPIWKMIWSNKAVLAVLWDMFPNHPNLIRSSFDIPTGDAVAKPLMSREGANVSIRKDGKILVETTGEYGEEGYVYQDIYQLPEMAPGCYPVIGSWVVDGEPAGMGIREDGLITGNTARFVPHIIR